MSERPTPITHVLEAGLYVRSIEKSRQFYTEVLGLGEPVVATEQITVYPIGRTTLILFQLGATYKDIHPNGSTEFAIPNHGPPKHIVDEQLADIGINKKPLKLHFCLAVPKREDVLQWEEFFRSKGVHILSVNNWERGGRSVYFSDPDGHVVEIASQGIWPHY